MKSAGQLQTLKVDITLPIPLNVDMTVSEICILVGHNGSGKSFVLKLNWALGFAMSLIASRKLTMRIEEIIQYVFDNTFENQNIDGTLEARFQNATFSVEFLEGRAVGGKLDMDDEVDCAPTPVYMSTTLRTFAQINQYLKTESLVGDKDKMLSMYKLYDVMFIERFRHFLATGGVVSETVKTSLANTFSLGFSVEKLFIKDDSVWFTDGDGKEKNLATLSAGEQSLINITVANSY